MDDEEEEAEEGKANFDRTTMPDTVICLEAMDEFLQERVMNLPESVVAGTHNTEEGLRKRLAEYRANNTEDESVANYFDELEIHPERRGRARNVIQRGEVGLETRSRDER